MTTTTTILIPKNKRKLDAVRDKVMAALAEISEAGKQAQHIISIEINCGEKGTVTNAKAGITTISKIDT